MMNDDPQATWESYYARIHDRRVSEAQILWADMQREGVDESVVLAVDFVHFSPDNTGAESLAAQLRENYSVAVDSDENSDYTLVKCTTRPYGVTFDGQEFSHWIDFMCEVGKSHGCVFSSWSAESPKLDRSWSNEGLDKGTD